MTIPGWVNDKPVPVAFGSGTLTPTPWGDSQTNGVPGPNLVTLNSDGSPNGAPIRVSTETMKIYASNLRLLAEPLKQVKTKLEGVEVEPGYFFEATDLVRRLQGPASTVAAGSTGGTATVTATYLGQLIDALLSTADALDALAVKYASAEELNGATTQQLAELFETAQGYLQNAAGPGIPV